MQNSSIADGTFYIAPQSGFVNISGIIEWSENSSKDYDLRIIVKNSGGSTISTSVIQSYAHTGTLISRQCVINRKINVLAGYKISMWLHDSTINTPFEFDFLAQTFLQHDTHVCNLWTMCDTCLTCAEHVGQMSSIEHTR
jgi:hypothetical protein